ncbi:MAG: Ig-like domain-containing protein, partial [Dehalococcoidaceae bacterium]|nr:Ig-like domain-containing protein [Dehalococcoidaceae bacterium]
TVYDDSGIPVPGERVFWSILDGPSSFVTDRVTYTDENGRATAIIISTSPGTSIIRASILRGELYQDAEKTWVAGPPASLDLTPETAINPVDTTHTLTALVMDSYGNPLEGVTINWVIESGPGAFTESQLQTGRDGKAQATITSSEGGVTVVRASASVQVTDTASKTWEAPPVVPEELFFTVDFLGVITRVPMGPDGSLLEPLQAPSGDGRSVLAMSAGTVCTDSQGNIISLLVLSEAPSLDLEEGTQAIVAYSLEPADVNFSKQVELTIGYTVDELPPDTESLSMDFYSIEVGWVLMEEEPNVVAGVGDFTGEVEQPGIYALLAVIRQVTPPEQPDLNVNFIGIQRQVTKLWEPFVFVVKVGEDSVLEAYVTNKGGQAGTLDVYLKLDGETVETQQVVLEPGSGKTVRFGIEGSKRGQYTVEVNGLTLSFNSDIWINWWLIVGLACALVLLIAIGMYTVQKKLNR